MTGKLVRDRIPELIRASGRAPSVRVLDTSAYEAALHEKLLEEAAELRAANNRREQVEEAADVLEVLTSLAALYGFTLDDVQRAAQNKAAERGGFGERLWLEEVDACR
ncbi:nucleoside triphosphate pyrophosphohydrolase [Nocardia brevicatena]|uniref:nucleoside triphosphate pyrophosphohydrolase n=1 Tax=Nocardia brevicatena TaxID=37327 RepID=UPI0005941C5F|nr:nucleoside triphosphate pyrophosphohydrolase [Nocardia brevicatena]